MKGAKNVIIDGVRYVPSFPDQPIGSLAGIIQKHRKALGMTLEQFAHCLGTTKSYVWDLENGLSVPGHKILRNLHTRIGIPAETLLLSE